MNKSRIKWWSDFGYITINPTGGGASKEKRFHWSLIIAVFWEKKEREYFKYINWVLKFYVKLKIIVFLYIFMFIYIYLQKSSCGNKLTYSPAVEDTIWDQPGLPVWGRVEWTQPVPGQSSTSWLFQLAARTLPLLLHGSIHSLYPGSCWCKPP